MKTSFLSFCLIASFVFLFTQCKKDDNPSPTATANYSPLTAGSSWTYNYTDGTTSGTTTLTATDRDTTINNKTYKVLTNSDNSGNGYLAKIDSNYYRYTSFPAIGNLEELYLKDNRAANSPWQISVPFTFPGSPLPLTADLTYTIKETGTSRTVNGKSYNEVVHVNAAVAITVTAGVSVDVGGGDFYYANNIGLIESSILITPPGQPSYTSTEQLVSVVIK